MVRHGGTTARRLGVVVLGVVDPDADTPVSVGMLRPDDKRLVHRVSALLRRQK